MHGGLERDESVAWMVANCAWNGPQPRIIVTSAQSLFLRTICERYGPWIGLYPHGC